MKTSVAEKNMLCRKWRKIWKYDGDVFLLLDKNSFATSHSKTFPWKPTRYNFFKEKLQLHRNYSVKKVFCNVSQNSQEKTCAGVSLCLEIFLKKIQHWCFLVNFANLGREIKSCPLWLKIGTHGILKVLIPNPGLGFWNLDPKIYFWANFGSKFQSCPFSLKTGVHSISRMLIPNPGLEFCYFDPKIHFCANLGPNIQSCLFVWKLVHMVSQRCWFLFQH